MDFPASVLQDIQHFKFFNLSGFNWMYTKSVQAADNNQQIVEGIAARFAQHTGVSLEKVRDGFEKFQSPGIENNLLLIYTCQNSNRVFIQTTSKNSDIYFSLSQPEYVNP